MHIEVFSLQAHSPPFFFQRANASCFFFFCSLLFFPFLYQSN
jgi:hypothetical protein